MSKVFHSFQAVFPSSYKLLPMVEKIVLFFATGGGVGFLPGPRGTYGTAIALLLYYLLGPLSFARYSIFVFLFSLAAIWIAGRAEKILREKDCQKIVIDEMAGYGVTLLFL